MKAFKFLCLAMVTAPVWVSIAMALLLMCLGAFALSYEVVQWILSF